MIDLFDTLGGTLNDMIGMHENNSTGYFWDQVYPKDSPRGYDEGGLVLPDGAATDDNLVQTLGKAASKTFKGGSSDSTLGGYYNSPEYVAQRYTQAGKFFNPETPRNELGSFKKPSEGKPTQAEDPSAFYSRWYMQMRRFAEASEVAAHGQTISRPR